MRIGTPRNDTKNMRHIPVLPNEITDLLQPKPNQNFIDCTLGDAGHAEMILGKTSPNGKLLGIDADPESLLRAKQYLYQFGERVVYARDNFVNLTKIVAENNFGPVNGILLDLGWSSPQFSERGRGFSFEKDEPLDMRYQGKSESQNPKSETTIETASEIVNHYHEEELARIFKTYGEENLSKEIAAAIVASRKKQPIERTSQLVEIILEVYQKKLHSTKQIPWIGGLHPATKVFQALRIEVNHELEILQQALPQAVEILCSGGHLAVISFHSLEDRIVKHYFTSIQNKLIKLVNKKPITASEEEIKRNPRARSAKLRVVEKMM